MSHEEKKPFKKQPGFIYRGDLCFFTRATTVYPADEDFSYNESLQRVIWPGEPLTYVKRMRLRRTGPWQHCFESHGLKYVFNGSIKDFTKEPVVYEETDAI